MSLPINATPFPTCTLHGLDSQQVWFDGALQSLPANRQINSPSDAPVVLALSGFAPMFGLPPATGIANDSASLLQTADDALSSVKANLLSLRERAVEAARATSSQSWREVLQAEVMQLAARRDKGKMQAKKAALPIKGFFLYCQLMSARVERRTHDTPKIDTEFQVRWSQPAHAANRCGYWLAGYAGNA